MTVVPFRSPSITPPTILDHALQWAARGFRVFLIVPRAKVPLAPKWHQTATADPAAIFEMFASAPDANYGVLCHDLIVVDVDEGKHPGAQAIYDSLGYAATLTVQSPSGGRHYYFSGPSLSPRPHVLGQGIDIRSGNGFVVGPGSYTVKSPTSAEGFYRVLHDLDVADAPESLIAACRKPREKTGERVVDWSAPPSSPARVDEVRRYLENDAHLAIQGAGGDHTTYTVACGVRDRGVTPAEALELMLEHWNDRCLPPWDPQELRQKVANAFAYGENEAGALAADKIFEGVVLPEEQRAHVEVIRRDELFDPWREISVPPPFPMDALPTVLREWVDVQSTLVGADPAAFAMAALTAASGALTHESRVQVKQHDNWEVSPRIWTLLVGNPSAKKSPVISRAVRPLHGIEADARRSHEMARSLKKSEEEAEDPPPPLRFIVRDTTPEALAMVLGQQNRGALVVQDEFSGFIGSLDRYTSGKANAAARAFFLQAYEGQPYTVDRKTAGSGVYVQNLSVSMLGGIQPARLAELGNLQSDGLLQRFVPVVMRPPSPDQDVPTDPNVGYRFDATLKRLANRPPLRYRLESHASRVRNEFAQEIAPLKDGGPAGFDGFVGKLEGLIGSFALVLHSLESEEEAIGNATMKRAARIMRDFIIPHGYLFYSECNGGGHSERNQALAAYILGHDEPVIQARHFARGPRVARDASRAELNRMLEPFVIGGWLTAEAPHPNNAKWTITPGLRDLFAEQLARYRTAVAAIQDKIRGTAA